MGERARFADCTYITKQGPANGFSITVENNRIEVQPLGPREGAMVNPHLREEVRIVQRTQNSAIGPQGRGTCPQSPSEDPQCTVAVKASHELARIIPKQIVEAQYLLVRSDYRTRIPA